MADNPPENLQQSIARLHAELAASPRVDPASRHLLREVLTDIERVLKAAPTQGQQGQSGGPATEGSVPRLEALAIEFEAEHPGLAGSLRQLMDLLGRGGF